MKFFLIRSFYYIHLMKAQIAFINKKTKLREQKMATQC